MARPRTRPPGSKPQKIWFSPYQRDHLNALSETNPLGAVSFQGLVDRAVDNFIAEQLADPATERRVREHMASRGQVVALRDVSRKKPDKR